MQNKTVVVITDCIDIAYNEIYAVLDTLINANDVKNVRIHPYVPVKKFSVINTAFSIRLLADLYGKDAYFLVIVSATKDSSERIFGKTKHGVVFVGNNSGYFGWMVNDYGCEYLYKNNITKDTDYKSFGGKFVQAPTMVKLLMGVDNTLLGEEVPADHLRSIIINDGTVVHCDNFGLMKIKGPIDVNLNDGDHLQIFVNDAPSVEAIFSKSMKKHEDGSWILYPGSSINGFLELGMVRHEDSASLLSVREGDKITWKIISR